MKKINQFAKAVKKRGGFYFDNFINKSKNKFSWRSSKRVFVEYVDDSRRSWENAFLSLWEPLYQRLSSGKALVKIKGIQISNNSKKSDDYESFARSFIGAAFFLHHKNETKIILSTAQEIDLAEVYQIGIANGTNPHHEEYWGKIRSDQVLVENFSIALGLLLTPQHTLSKFSDQEKTRIASWFKKCLKKKFCENNWEWFKVFHYLILEGLEDENYQEKIEKCLNEVDRFYEGDGWYTDGLFQNEKRFDYYNSWSFHFYALMFSYLAGEKFPKWKKKYEKRAKIFLNDYQYFLTPGNLPPFFGRSQLYRFATFAPWGPAYALNTTDVDLKWVKKSAIDSVNIFLANGVKQDGILSMGYLDESSKMLEKYSGAGSPYWAFKAFSVFLLPESHPFWKAKTAKVSPRKIIHSSKGPKMVLKHDGQSQITLFNFGSTNTRDPNKYNKFVYSNIFLPNLKGLPVDNTLLVKKRKHGRWRARGKIIESKCTKKQCEMKWSPLGLPKTIIQTIIKPEDDGYVIEHRYDGKGSLYFQTGGFVLVQDDQKIVVEREQREMTVIGRNKTVALEIVSDQGKLFVAKSKDVNILGKYSYTPCLKGKIDQVDSLNLKFKAVIL